MKNNLELWARPVQLSPQAAAAALVLIGLTVLATVSLCRRGNHEGSSREQAVPLCCARPPLREDLHPAVCRPGSSCPRIRRNTASMSYSATWDQGSNASLVVVVFPLLSCVKLCDPMDCSMPGSSVLCYLLEFAQFMSTELVMLSNHLILCHPLLLPSIFPNIRVFSSESALHIRWPKYWRFSISPSNEYSGLISFRIDWFDLLAVQGTLRVFFSTTI